MGIKKTFFELGRWRNNDDHLLVRLTSRIRDLYCIHTRSGLIFQNKLQLTIYVTG